MSSFLLLTLCSHRLNWALQDPQRFGSFGLGRLAKDFGNDWKGEYVSPVLGKAAFLASARPDVDFLRKQLANGKRKFV